MKRKRFLLSATLLHLVALGLSAQADIPTTTGAITRVTVYRGQALVTRQIEVDLPDDGSELVVNDLPANIIPESIYAQAADATKVLSLRYREQAVKEDTREEVKQLDQQIEQAQNQLKHDESKLEHLKKQWQMFEKLKEFSVAAVGSDLNRGLLTYEPIQDLTRLIEEKGTEYLDRQLTLEDAIAEDKKVLDLLGRKRNELTAGRSRTERQVILFLGDRLQNRVRLTLNYLVNGANWQQQYNLRAQSDSSTVAIEYNAVVNQTSGEDWNGAQERNSALGLQPRPTDARPEGHPRHV